MKLDNLLTLEYGSFDTGYIQKISKKHLYYSMLRWGLCKIC